MPFSIPEHIKAELRALDVHRECPICLDSIPFGKVDLTDCGHYFCTSCIDSAKDSCPVCRNDCLRVSKSRTKIKSRTVITKTVTTTTITEDILDDGRYEVVGDEVCYILPNGNCYMLDPTTLSVPHTFIGRINADRSVILTDVDE